MLSCFHEDFPVKEGMFLTGGPQGRREVGPLLWRGGYSVNLLHVASVKVNSFICEETCPIFGKIELACIGKATSQDQSKLFTSDEKIRKKIFFSCLQISE